MEEYFSAKQLEEFWEACETMARQRGYKSLHDPEMPEPERIEIVRRCLQDYGFKESLGSSPESPSK